MFVLVKTAKALAETQGPQDGANLRFLSPKQDTTLHCDITDTGLVHRVVWPFTNSPAFAANRCAYTRRDGEAEFT